MEEEVIVIWGTVEYIPGMRRASVTDSEFFCNAGASSPLLPLVHP